MSWFSRFLRWFKRTRSADTQQLSVCHELVLSRYPDTPWVHNGYWSWFHSDLSELPTNAQWVVYPYLPLVLLEADEDDPIVAVLSMSCERYRIPLYRVRNGVGGLMKVLEERYGR